MRPSTAEGNSQEDGKRLWNRDRNGTDSNLGIRDGCFHGKEAQGKFPHLGPS